jgi:hypothetical protein
LEFGAKPVKVDNDLREFLAMSDVPSPIPLQRAMPTG